VRLGDIDFPDELIDAHGAGHLVVFAGAGVSLPPPTSLPSFKRLAEQVGLEAGLPLGRFEPLDAYLGRVAAAGYMVHERVAEIINAGGAPNIVHDAVLGLFNDAASVRIVTTNFDRKLWEASSRWAEPPREYVAPALPFGGDMGGIVYLHGAVHDSIPRLVITDGDFGSAYLSRGHATRFLLDLYASNTVLFVGYSHSDAILTYLARGLAPGIGRRFALSNRRDFDRWRSLMVEPIEIPSRHGLRRQRSLANGLSAWGRYNRMGFADHNQRIAEIARRGPGRDPEERDYVLARIADPDTCVFFCRAATQIEWLDWLAEQPLFARVLQSHPSVGDEAIHGMLSDWIASNFVSQHSNAAIRSIVRLERPLSVRLWRSIVWALAANRPEPDDLRTWVVFLLAVAPDGGGDELGRLLRESRPRDDDRVAATLYDWLTDPAPEVSSPLVPDLTGETLRVEMSTRGESREVLEAYERVILPRPDAFARRLLPVIGHHLEKAHATFRLAGRASDGHDPDSFRRSAIEPDPQDDGLPEWNQPLVDGGRDLLVWARENDAAFGSAITEWWARADAPLLRRLAVHAVGSSPRLTPDERVTWLIDGSFLYSTLAHHEVFIALRAAYAGLTDVGRLRLLDAIDAGSTEPAIANDPDLAIRVRFDRVEWLLDVEPQDDALLGRRQDLLSLRPGMAPRPHPDRLLWREAGYVPGPSAPDVRRLLDLDPTEPATLNGLLAPRAGDPFAPSNDELVAAAARERPDWAISLAYALAERREWASDLWVSLADAWSEATLDHAQWSEVVELIEKHGDPGVHVLSFAGLLDRGLRASPPRIPADLLERVEGIAVDLWAALPEATGEDAVVVGRDWLSEAINHAAGRLALVLIQLIALDRPLTAGIDAERRAWLGPILDEGSSAGGFARAVFASQLHFLLSVDRRWTIDTVVPWFDWAGDAAVASQAWDGFLTWGRIDPDIASLLLPSYESTFAHLAELGDMRERFTEHLSAVAFFVEPIPVPGSWLFQFVNQAGPDDLRDWARQIGYQLRRMEEPQLTQAFDRWIGAYWELRTHGRPKALTPGETTAMLGWALSFGDLFERAVACARAMPITAPENMFVHEFESSDLATRYPQSATDLLEHALRGHTAGAFWECTEAQRIGSRALASGSVSDASRRALIEQLVRLGCRTGDLS
jgi:hypothetical protein